MASKRFKTLFDRNVSRFVGYFSEDSTKLFETDKKVLIHPGEYGRYRENVCKNMLQLVLNNHVSIEDGFVITSDDSITTQCDIIVYNSGITPIITDNVSRMFPAEEVRLIFEIKSKLTKSEYIKALRKMAENKKIIIEGRNGIATEKNDKDKAHDTIGTFLICSKLDFNYKNLCYNEIYEGIERKYWHNAVLSVEDGLFTYALDFSNASQNIKDVLVEKKYNIEKMVLWGFSNFYYGQEILENPENEIVISLEDKYRHIIQFFVLVSNINKAVWTYEYDPIVYLGYYSKELLTE